MITPAMELAEKILEQIDRHPESHEQAHWGEKTECGTSACICGWAALINEDAHYEPLFAGSTHDILVLNSGAGDDWINYGAKVLGLSVMDADRLFMNTNNEEAKEALKYIAKGDRIPWHEIMGDD